MPLVFGGLIILILILVLVTHGGFNSHTPPAYSAMDLAMSRYAKGEINRAQYHQIIEDLKR
jgi:uncharacterized membrane protein